MRDNERKQYDDLLDAGGLTSLDRCPVCEDGDDDNLPCSDECGDIQLRIARQRRIERYYGQAKTALRLARAYRNEETGGQRERACVSRVKDLRLCIFFARTVQRLDDKDRKAS